MPHIYDNYSDEQIIEQIKLFEADKAEADGNIKFAKNVLLERKQEEISAALQAKTEPFGAVSQVIGDQKVTFTTPKKVEWDQEGLGGAYRQMIADGAKPEEYVQAEFKIKEDAYKNWPSDIKEYFEPFRTVKSGPVAIKIEAAKEK